MALLIFYVTLALGVSFLCSIMEAVLLSVTPSFVARAEAERGLPGKKLADLKQDVDRPLAAILSLNTIAHTVGAAGAGATTGATDSGPDVTSPSAGTITVGGVVRTTVGSSGVGASSIAGAVGIGGAIGRALEAGSAGGSSWSGSKRTRASGAGSTTGSGDATAALGDSTTESQDNVGMRLVRAPSGWAMHGHRHTTGRS